MVWSDHRVASLLPNSSAQFCGRVEWQVGIRGMAEAERSDERALRYITSYSGWAQALLCVTTALWSAGCVSRPTTSNFLAPRWSIKGISLIKVREVIEALMPHHRPAGDR